MNPYLRQALDAADQQALMDHAAETSRSEPVNNESPSCRAGPPRKLPPQRMFRYVAAATAWCSMCTCNFRHDSLAVPHVDPPIPRLAGRSSSLRRSCQQVERCYRDREWVVIEGESGTGRTSWARPSPSTSPRSAPFAFFGSRVSTPPTILSPRSKLKRMVTISPS